MSEPAPQPIPESGINPDFNLSQHIEHDMQGIPEQPGIEWPIAVNAARNITQQIDALRDQEHKARYEATHDELTNLLNLRGFNHKLEIYLTQTQVRELDVLFVDGTNIKRINDTFDHDEGDKVIKGMASILSRSIRKGDILARIGGDEFVIVPTVNKDGDALEAVEMDRRAADVTKPDKSPLERRIAQLTSEFLQENPSYAEAGMDIAVGRKHVVIDESFDFDTVRNEAEEEMKLHKATQHEEKGQYR